MICFLEYKIIQFQETPQKNVASMKRELYLFFLSYINMFFSYNLLILSFLCLTCLSLDYTMNLFKINFLFLIYFKISLIFLTVSRTNNSFLFIYVSCPFKGFRFTALFPVTIKRAVFDFNVFNQTHSYFHFLCRMSLYTNMTF